MSEWDFQQASRSNAKLRIVVCGPSGGGKTHSMLRLQAGIARVVHGPKLLIDTDNHRSGLKAGTFDFQSLGLGLPHSPARYIQAIQSAQRRAPSSLIIDGLTEEHMHMLDQQTEALERLVKQAASHPRNRGAAPWEIEKKVQQSSWAAVKKERKKLQTYLNALPTHMLMSMRTRPKLDTKSKELDPDKKQGVVGSVELIETATVVFYLPANSKGVPEFAPKGPVADVITKLPEEMAHCVPPGQALCEDHGEAMARWLLEGEKRPAPEQSASQLLDGFGLQLDQCATIEQLKAIFALGYRQMVEADRASFKAHYENRKAEINGDQEEKGNEKEGGR